MPHLHWHECAEMGSTYFDTDGFGVPFPEQNQGPHNFTNNQATVRRAYYGCISYVDSLIGELLQALKDGGAEPHTAVVFTVRSFATASQASHCVFGSRFQKRSCGQGDHGWHLGEHDVRRATIRPLFVRASRNRKADRIFCRQMWCKMSCLELGTRVPLIFKAPWLTGKMTGTASGALAELVDMYPTLSELAGLTLPTGPAGEYLGGTSLVPVLSGSAKQVKNCTISQFPRCCKTAMLSRFCRALPSR